MKKTAFAERLDGDYETERKVKDDMNIFGLRKWKDEIFIY